VDRIRNGNIKKHLQESAQIMKPAQEVAEELCRWFYPDNEPIELADVAHTQEVIARCYADAMRHAAELCWQRKVAGTTDVDYNHNLACQECAKAIQAEADKLKP